MGAAMSVVAAFEAMILDSLRVEHIYTFGEPRVGNDVFATMFEKTLESQGVPYFRITQYKVFYDVPLPCFNITN